MNIAFIGDSFPDSLLLENDGYPSILKKELQLQHGKIVNIEKYTKSGVVTSDIRDLLDEKFYQTDWDYVILHFGNFEAFPALSKSAHKFLFNRWIKEDLRHRLKYRNRLTEYSFELKQNLRCILNDSYGVDFKISKEMYYQNYKDVVEHLRDKGKKNIILISLSKVDEHINQNYNHYINDYNEAIEEISKELSIPLVDIFDINETTNQYIYTKDGWHWNEFGHALVAKRMLKEIFKVEMKNIFKYYDFPSRMEKIESKSIFKIVSKNHILRLLEIFCLKILGTYIKCINRNKRKRGLKKDE
ncbi:SGNH/GDSL hydrolase family protein [Bacillus bombysepticus]|uniref:SGNH hydrolase-type esterase domain-containing protein n=1 Tax=Bacillus bombysepticus str. Wang TaxID=1330043 RepID=A0A9W3PTC1_9BACI|nr:SGNH/GDSL hydrolase family protein [Bacillus bombysepticus]AHX21206.1 hypothetical protein CY96_25450 [Bacillus bombysepticus str. Wang]